MAHPLSPTAQAYLRALRSADIFRASELVKQEIALGVKVADLYIHLFQPVLYEVGRLWEINEISVADEHYYTAATQTIMSQLYPLIFRTPRIGRRMIGACMSGEQHEIGIRMVCDFFQMHGWDTHYLGARMPFDSLLRMIRERRPELVALSATLLPHVDEMGRTIAALRREFGRDCPRILVGGQPLNHQPGLLSTLGADAHAPDAMLAVQSTRLCQAA